MLNKDMAFNEFASQNFEKFFKETDSGLALKEGVEDLDIETDDKNEYKEAPEQNYDDSLYYDDDIDMVEDDIMVLRNIQQFKEMEEVLNQNNNKVVSINKKRNKNKEKENDTIYTRVYSKGGKFKADVLAEEIMKQLSVITINGKMYHYDKRKGKYIVDVETNIKKKIYAFMKKADRYNLGHLNLTMETLKIISSRDKIQMNKDSKYINVKNGLLNIETMELEEHSNKELQTIQINANYDKNANDPIVDNFIKSIVPEDHVNLIYEMIGYTLLRNLKYQKAFLLLGEGGNGKSVLIDTIINLLQLENTTSVSIQDLTENRFKSAQLLNKSLNVYDDLPFYRIRDTSRFKTAVTGGILDAEFKGKDSFTFNPFATHIYATNELPTSIDNTYGYFRRLIIIEMPYKFTGDNKDINLIDKLKTESAMSTLLNRALEGIKRLQQNGKFDIPFRSYELQKKYRNSNDSVQAFKEDCLTFDSEANELTKTINEAYTQYCNKNGIMNKVGRNQLFEKLCKIEGIEKKRLTGKSSQSFVGLKLNSDFTNNIFD